MSKDNLKQPIQVELFVTSLSSGEAMPRDLSSEDNGAVSITERYIHLDNALDLFDRVLDLDRKAKLFPSPVKPSKDFVPTKQQAISINSAKAAVEMRLSARQEFYQAYGLSALISSEVNPKDELEKEASKNYDKFTMRFAGKHKFKERIKAQQAWRNLLSQHLEIEPDTAAESKDTESIPGSQAEENSGLSTREKLIILAEADDAGFLPTTNEEKNMVITYLDYIKNQQYELGTQNQLIEIGNFHGKHHDFATAKEYSHQAGRSIAHEFGDWLKQSSEQLEDLQAVKDLIHDIDNPNLSLAVAFNADMEKAIPLIRFVDLREFRATGKIEYKTQKGKISPVFNTLLTKRNEDEENLLPGKNKVIEDPYTGKRTDAVTEWLKIRMNQLKVRDVRELINFAIDDQEKRVIFHRLVLEDLATEKTDSEMLKEASKVANLILKESI